VVHNERICKHKKVKRVTEKCCSATTHKLSVKLRRRFLFKFNISFGTVPRILLDTISIVPRADIWPISVAMVPVSWLKLKSKLSMTRRKTIEEEG
jgi:hypothetical protein